LQALKGVTDKAAETQTELLKISHLCNQKAWIQCLALDN
ncbi:hypothetical protein LCGC14_2236080, partial [marine sediment metagenome]